MNETSNREMITISRAKYEAMQAQLDAMIAELAEQPIVLCDYQSNRKAENAETFPEGFSGWLHARRKFNKALTAIPKEQQPASKPAEALCYFAKLFQLEQEFALLTAEKRFAKRLEQEKPILKALLA